MRRGDIVTIATGGGFGGKPRPAVIMQADAFERLTTLIVIPFTTSLVDQPNPLRIRVEPDEANGLNQTSELMIHVPITARRTEIGKHVGQLSPDDMARVERALVLVLGFAG